MKPRIFINMHYMELGGAERALLGLLNALDTDKVDVDLFLNQHTGEFKRRTIRCRFWEMESPPPL